MRWVTLTPKFAENELSELLEFIEKHKHPDFFVFRPEELERMMEKLEQVDRPYHVREMIQIFSNHFSKICPSIDHLSI